MRYQNKKTIMLYLILAIGLAGTIGFFPLKLDSGKTCLLHLKPSTHHHAELVQDNHHQYSVLIKCYLMPYALCWWLSLAVVSYASYKIKTDIVRGK